MLKNNKIKEQCDQLVLFTSESCNLQCSYCDMANHINKQAHHSEAIKVKQSLITGEYFKNVQKAMERLEIPPSNITAIELWGQEPTLTLEDFSKNFINFYNFLPKLNSLFFSTNGVSNTQAIVDFTNLINNTINHAFTLAIQFSYDGKKATKEHRGANPKNIIDNIIYFINSLNAINIQKDFKIVISIHNVIDDEIINYYSQEKNEKELYKFLKEFDDLSEMLIELNNSKQITVRPAAPGIITPYNASVEDGKNLYKFYQQCEKIGKVFRYQTWKGLPKQLFDRPLETKYYDAKAILLDSNTLKDLDQVRLTNFSHRVNCGFNTYSLKMRYDGTLIHCQNALLGLTENELKNQQGHDYQIQRRRVQKHFYPNVLTDSDEIIDSYLYECNLQSDKSFFLAFSQVSSLMSALLHAKQIDEKYYDKSEFLKCAYFLTLSTSCPHNAMMQTGTLYGKYAGWIRFLCNGFMDIIQNEFEQYLKIQQEMKKNDTK